MAKEKALIAELTGDEDNSASRTFVFQGEGHTLGNALRPIIATYNDVTFCGYNVPHPAEKKMHLRIQTSGVPAIDVLYRGLKDLSDMCDLTIEKFNSAVESFQESNEVPVSNEF